MQLNSLFNVEVHYVSSGPIILILLVDWVKLQKLPPNQTTTYTQNHPHSSRSELDGEIQRLLL